MLDAVRDMERLSRTLAGQCSMPTSVHHEAVAHLLMLVRIAGVPQTEQQQLELVFAALTRASKARNAFKRVTELAQAVQFGQWELDRQAHTLALELLLTQACGRTVTPGDYFAPLVGAENLPDGNTDWPRTMRLALLLVDSHVVDIMHEGRPIAAAAAVLSVAVCLTCRAASSSVHALRRWVESAGVEWSECRSELERLGRLQTPADAEVTAAVSRLLIIE